MERWTTRSEVRRIVVERILWQRFTKPYFPEETTGINY
jgi:hypothetical protein